MQQITHISHLQIEELFPIVVAQLLLALLLRQTVSVCVESVSGPRDGVAHHRRKGGERGTLAQARRRRRGILFAIDYLLQTLFAVQLRVDGGGIAEGRHDRRMSCWLVCGAEAVGWLVM